MNSGIGRPILVAAILVCAVLETTMAHGNVAVALFGATALVLSGCVLPLLPWHRFRADVLALAHGRPLGEPADDRYADEHPLSGAEGIGPHPIASQRGEVALAQPRSSTTLASASAEPEPEARSGPVVPQQRFPAPPRFGTRGSPASRMPWLLPRISAPAAIQADEAEIRGVSVRAASVVGPGHRCAEPAQPRQDAYGLGRDADGRFLIIAVADGLSSGVRSELGAGIAVRRAVDDVRTSLAAVPSLAELDAEAVFGSTAAAMNDGATEADLSPSDICAVLVTAVIDLRPDPAGVHPMWFAWIGDVSVWALEGGGWAFLAGDAKGGVPGIASNAVHACLPQHPDRVRHRTVAVRAGEAIAVVTDGIGDALTDIPEANAYFAQRWARPPALGAFLNDLCFDARQQLDDRTAVVLWTPAAEKS